MTDITLTEGKETAIPDIHTHVGAALDGTVVDAETGTPLAGARFDLHQGKKTDIESWVARRHTDQQGHFFYRTLPKQLTLLCSHPPQGYLKQQSTDALTVELQEGEGVHRHRVGNETAQEYDTVINGKNSRQFPLQLPVESAYSTASRLDWTEVP